MKKEGKKALHQNKRLPEVFAPLAQRSSCAEEDWGILKTIKEEPPTVTPCNAAK
jgi:hypothetical protein